MKQKIAVVYGGYSSEVEISIKSGKNVAANIDTNLFDVYEVLLTRDRWCVVRGEESFPIDRSDFSCTIDGKKVRFDKAFIIIHGTPGENGILQAYFELIGLPFAGSSSIVSTISFDKYACKRYLSDSKVKMAKDLFLRKGDTYDVNDIVERLGLPIFVKPNNGGSSFGVTKVKKKEDIDKAVSLAFSQDDTLIMEEAVIGREIDCGVYSDGKGVYALPLIEIVSHNEYFDYEAKYLGQSDELCPAPISDALKQKVQQEAVRIFKHLGCKGLMRIDFITRGEEVFFLEVNINPGMTAESLVPKMIVEAGMNLKDFMSSILLDR